jgi:ATP-binding cassette subfamily C protein
MVVISADSGAGKSTFLRLLLGFEKPECGEIRFDGHRLSELDLASLRSRIGVVLQNPFLSQGSIFQNIAAGDDLSLDEAWRAAERAGMAAEIRALPMGMHSLVGAHGANFPAGQRRRIALARALARRSDILLLDEPTNGLDLRTRQQIWAALDGLRLTRIIVSHDAEPGSADRILRLENGRLRSA